LNFSDDAYASTSKVEGKKDSSHPSMAPQHFLVVAFPGQGHINPARALAELPADATGAGGGCVRRQGRG
jgi:hypothetical protein